MNVFCINCDEKVSEVILTYNNFYKEYECFCPKCKELIYVPIINDINVEERRKRRENAQ